MESNTSNYDSLVAKGGHRLLDIGGRCKVFQKQTLWNLLFDCLTTETERKRDGQTALERRCDSQTWEY